MERVRRRFWTWAVTGLAGLVILAAAVSGLFQLAVLALPSYREELATWVTRVAERPVEIGGINLAWRGIYPRINLTGITLYDEDGREALTAERISLGFSGPRLLMGELTPTRIELSDLSLAADIDEQGRLSVAGFETLGGEAFPRRDQLLKELSRFERVRLRNCELQLTHAKLGRTPLQFRLVDADIERRRGGFDADAEIQLPAAYGERVELAASIDGALGLPDQWNGEFDFTADGLRVEPWLQRWLQTGTVIETRELGLQGEGELRAGRIAGLRLGAEAEALVVARSGQAHLAKALRLDLALQPDGHGWRADIRRFEQDGVALLRGGLRYRKAVEGGGFELDADLDQLTLAPFTAWLAHARAASALLRQVARLQGELGGLVLRLRGGDALRYSLRSDLKNLSLSGGKAAGFQQLDGVLSATEEGGRLQLAGGPLVFSAPQQIGPPLAFDALDGELEWTRAVSGWTLSSKSFGWKLAGTRGSGSLRLELPSDRQKSPRLELDASFSAGDVNALKPLMPLKWGAPLRDWLTRALQSGRVPRGRLSIRGPTFEFPFADGKSGEWKLELDVANARLAFAPDWPALENVAARLKFHGNALEISADAASIGGNRIERVTASFTDLRDGVLRVDGQLRGEVARFYELLRKTPLQKPLAGLLSRTRAAGPARVSVQLEIPVQHAADTRVAGEVSLDGVQLFYENLDQPVDDIRGSLRFGSRHVEADRLDARFADLRLTARIEPRPKTAGLIVAEFAYAPQPAGGVSDFIPGFVRTRLSGESRWRAELPVDAPDAALTLTSDLRGTSVQLPPPLGKAAADAAPIRLSLGSDAAAPLRVRLDYAQRLGADVALARRDKSLRAQAVSLQLGGGLPAPAREPGIFVSGEVAELDLEQWGAALAGNGGGSEGGEGPGAGLSLREIQLGAGRWLVDEHIIEGGRLHWLPSAEGWRASLDGGGAKGELSYDRGNGGVLSAKLQHLRLQRRPPTPASGDAPASASTSDAPGRDPTRWPTLDLDCQQLVANEVELGRLRLRSQRIADGQRLETLAIEGGKLQLASSGAWHRSQARSTAEFKFEVQSDDLAAVLRAFGYTPNLSGRSSRFSGELSWPAAPRLDWQQAAGRVSLEVQSGTLKAVEPGAGRVLGLFNLYAIPRRLALDFRDVVSSGFGFDTLRGSFTLGGGVATTKDLEIRGPSLRMEMRGRIGLAARDFDQTVKVYPDVSSGVTLGAALLGGPALGALVLLAQQVLDKPLEQATQLSYRVTGSWDNPRIERGSAN